MIVCRDSNRSLYTISDTDTKEWNMDPQNRGTGNRGKPKKYDLRGYNNALYDHIRVMMEQLFFVFIQRLF